MESFSCQVDWKCRYAGTRTVLFLLTLCCDSPLGTSLKHWWHLEIYEWGSDSVMTFSWFCSVLFLQLLSNFNICLYYNLLCECALFWGSEVLCKHELSHTALLRYGTTIMHHVWGWLSANMKKELYSIFFQKSRVYYCSQSRNLLSSA